MMMKIPFLYHFLQADAMELIHDLAEMDPELNTSTVLSELGEFNAKKKFFAKQFVWKAAEKTDPVTWWTGICSITELSKIAEAILSCPPTSAAAERSFSVHGNIHSAKRNKLTTRRAGKLVYISHNIQLLGDFNFLSTQSQRTPQSASSTPKRGEQVSPPPPEFDNSSLPSVTEDWQEELEASNSSDEENSDSFTQISLHDSSEYSDESFGEFDDDF